jgi:hypothetical protein
MKTFSMSQILTYRPLWLLLLILVLLRLPSLNRPLSKHDDFNTAVILINAISWQQAGGGHHFQYTPLMNFQGKANKIIEKGFHIDSSNNQVYLSFGAGWYVLPYFVFSALHVDATPMALQLLSICIGLLSACLLFGFLAAATGNTHSAFFGTLLFIFLPASLWYLGISYVTTGIMMPLVIWILLLWQRLAKDASVIGASWLIQLAVACMLLTYIDWVSVFLAGSLVVWSLIKSFRQKEFLLVAFVATASVALAIFLILWQYASYLGWPQVMGYWQSRFAERSTGTPGMGYIQNIQVFVRFIVAGYWPLFMLLAAFLFLKRQKLPAHLRWIFFAVAAMLVYNMVFLNWSLEHEFAWLALSLVVCIFISFHFGHTLAINHWAIYGLVYVAFCTLTFFYVNRPGPISRNGTRYDSAMNMGKQIADSIPSTAFIFTNLPNAKIEEYYAKRSFNLVPNMQLAKTIADSLHLRKAYWLSIQNELTLNIQLVK